MNRDMPSAVLSFAEELPLPAVATPQSRLAAAIAILLALMCLCIILVDGSQIIKARSTEVHETEVITANLSRSLARQADDTIKAADTILIALVDQLEFNARHAPRPVDILRYRSLMRLQANELPQLSELYVVDEKTHCVMYLHDTTSACSRAVASDYFQYHRRHADGGPYVGLPTRQPGDVGWTLSVSRRINHGDGSFAGVAVAAINLDYFSQVYKSFDIGKQGAITLVRTDGILLARVPTSDIAIGTDLRSNILFDKPMAPGFSATHMFVSPFDGIQRITSYQRLGMFPLVVVVALSKDESLAEWRQDALRHAIGLTLLVSGVGLLGWRLARQIILRLKTESELVRTRDELQHVNRTLQVMALQDSLTGLPNRRHFDATLDSEFRRALRNGGLLALIMIDVDCFKQYNDIYGHPAGDTCLEQVARVIQACRRRPGDMVARHGGEEFAVLLPATDLPGALAIAEQIRASVLALKLQHNGHALGIVSVSAGVDAIAPVQELNTSLQLLRHSDQALYAAKSAGRNCVRAHLDVTVTVED